MGLVQSINQSINPLTLHELGKTKNIKTNEGNKNGRKTSARDMFIILYKQYKCMCLCVFF